MRGAQRAAGRDAVRRRPTPGSRCGARAASARRRPRPDRTRCVTSRGASTVAAVAARDDARLSSPCAFRNSAIQSDERRLAAAADGQVADHDDGDSGVRGLEAAVRQKRQAPQATTPRRTARLTGHSSQASGAAAVPVLQDESGKTFGDAGRENVVCPVLRCYCGLRGEGDLRQAGDARGFHARGSPTGAWRGVGADDHDRLPQRRRRAAAARPASCSMLRNGTGVVDTYWPLAFDQHVDLAGPLELLLGVGGGQVDLQFGVLASRWW